MLPIAEELGGDFCGMPKDLHPSAEPLRQPPAGVSADMLLLSRLWSEAQPVVAAMIAGAVVDFQHAEDLVSQVAETVVMKFGDYDRSRPFVPWALGIARNIVLRHYERRAGDRLVFFDECTLGALAVAQEEVAGEAAERLALMRQCLAEVKGKTRRVMEMRYLHGLKPAAIGRALDMTSNAVWVMLHRGREAVARCVQVKLATSSEGEA
jgi:RNA polymerase sigma-70 factor, ECF subfamily